MVDATELITRFVWNIFALSAILIFSFLRKKYPYPLFSNWRLSIRERAAFVSLFFVIVVAVLFLKPLLAVPFSFATIVIATVFLLQPFLEEILVRGLFLGSMLKLFNNNHKFVLIIVQSIMFTILHFRTGILPIVLLMATGVFYGFLFVIFKKNLWPPTAAHLVYNYVVYQLGFWGM